MITALGHRPRAERRARAEQLLALVHSVDGSRSPAAASCRAASASASRWPGRWRASRRCCCSTSRSPRSIARVRRRLQDEIDELRRTLDIPLILVTHDFDDVVRLATHLLMLERGRGVASGRCRR